MNIPALDHAAVGNGRVLALVAPTTAVEWLCLPRFDSPSVFARLLDAARGGTFRVLPDGEERVGRQRYVPNTNVVTTRLEAAGGVLDVTDFAPRIPRGVGVHAPVEFMRLVEPVGGSPTVVVDFDPRPDYARVQPALEAGPGVIAIGGGPAPLRLLTNAPIPYLLERRPFVVHEPLWFVLQHGGDAAERRGGLPAVREELALTVAGWRAWARTCGLPRFASEAVLRSALCLKLHISEDTGAVIAAATTSIPEEMGTPRTWDYRFCWLRDAAFTVDALRRLSHLPELLRFTHYLQDLLAGGPLQPVYGIGGERDLTESFLGHLAGFGGNGHVRIGNAAALQRQNDLMGELVLCLGTALQDPRILPEERGDLFPVVRQLVEAAMADAEQPDMGIWEFRTQLRHHVFSRAMCWAAAHHGAEMARRAGHDDLAARWDDWAAGQRAVILAHGFSEEHGCFTQALDGQYADASNLLLPMLGLVHPRDPRFVRTVEAYQQRLVRNGLMLRYANVDDIGVTRSAFTMCSFWWSEALALMGRLEEAETVFRRVLTYANPHGLFSEDVDPDSRRLLGNFPQVYTHVGLIHAAITIGQAREAEEGRARAWA
ncbi:MAG TPA: glycoside hydrolase family 15 protein [Gemmatimonadales bacterium]|nr:glycoside hydrolase family 15 protein [Gemmatimonadales bacterium]